MDKIKIKFISEISGAVLSCQVPGSTLGSSSMHIPKKEYIQVMTSKAGRYVYGKESNDTYQTYSSTRPASCTKYLGSSIGEMPVRIYFVSFINQMVLGLTVPQPHQWVCQGNDPA